jgi:hypothetical protein
MEKLKDVEGKCTHLQENLEKYVSVPHTNDCRMLELSISGFDCSFIF